MLPAGGDDTKTRLYTGAATALCAAAVALVLAASAGGRSAADPPAELFVFPADNAPGAAAETNIEFFVPDTSSLATASVTVYLPSGFGVDTAKPPGTAVGKAGLFLQGETDPVQADLLTADPAAYTTDPAAQACAPGAHAAVWKGVFSVAGTTMTVTVFVDPTTGDEASRGGFKLVYCLPSPSVPPAQGGSPGGERILDLDLDLQNELTNPAAGGLFTWRAFVTPYQAGTATPVPSGAFEVRSIVALPQVLTMKATFVAAKNTLVVNGRLLSVGAPRSLVNIHVLVASKSDGSDATELGVPVTKSDGTYLLKRVVRRRKTPLKLFLLAYVNFYGGSCTDPPLIPGGCAEQTIAPPPSKLARVTVPKLAPKPKPKPKKKH